jgi:hypothetical protein
MDNSKCVVLVPVGTSIEHDCERGLRRLEERGYTVRRVPGYTAIDQARNQISSDALEDGFDELMWIDSDIGFDPDDVDKLRKHNLPIVCGIYPKKGQRELSCHVVPGTTSLVFGKQGGLIRLTYAATGFLLTKRQVYKDIQEKLVLPVCNQRFGKTMVPYFLPLVVPDGKHGHWCLAEDFAFSERAKRAGYEVMADTSIRLLHIGRYSYSFEDAGSVLTRYGTYNLNLPSQIEINTRKRDVD